MYPENVDLTKARYFLLQASQKYKEASEVIEQNIYTALHLMESGDDFMDNALKAMGAPEA